MKYCNIISNSFLGEDRRVIYLPIPQTALAFEGPPKPVVWILPSEILPPVGEWSSESKIRSLDFALRDFAPGILPTVGECFSESKIRCPDPRWYRVLVSLFGSQLLQIPFTGSFVVLMKCCPL